MVRNYPLFIATAMVGFLLILSGCVKSDEAKQPANAKNGTAKLAAKADQKTGGLDVEHGHKAGAHNGIIVSIGQDSYHAEAVFEKNGLLRVYTLGQDETRILEVEAQPVKAFVKAEGDPESQEIVLLPEPQDGDAKGKTSQFVGKLPSELSGKKVEVTITNFRIGDERFRLGFSNIQAVGAHDVAMPKAVAGDEERKLYLEPGGIYTMADIKANGNVTASQKFKGIRAEHDMHPKPGDKICPVTDTKANPKFSWIINGQNYEFCCPPCIDEFVSRAKDDPTSILPPEKYVKK